MDVVHRWAPWQQQGGRWPVMRDVADAPRQCWGVGLLAVAASACWALMAGGGAGDTGW